MYNYKQILEWKYAGCNYTISDAYDYSTLVWNDSSQKPSQELLETKIELIKTLNDFKHFHFMTGLV